MFAILVSINLPVSSTCVSTIVTYVDLGSVYSYPLYATRFLQILTKMLIPPHTRKLGLVQTSKEQTIFAMGCGKEHLATSKDLRFDVGCLTY